MSCISIFGQLPPPVFFALALNALAVLLALLYFGVILGTKWGQGAPKC